MTAGAPWSVKGIDPKAREVAKDHARRSGLTLGEWLNRVILDDESADGQPGLDAYSAPEPPRVFSEAPRPRLVADNAAPRPDELARVAHALDRLTDRIEASETRTGLAISGVEHSIRQAVARIEAAERENLAVAARFDGSVERVSGEQGRLAERLRRFESDAAGPRSTEAMRAIEQSVTRLAGQLYEGESRLARVEARAAVDPGLIDEVVQRLGDRLAQAEHQTGDSLDALRRSMAALDGRVGRVEGDGGADRRFEALAQDLTAQVEAARAEVSDRLKAVDAGRVDWRFAELAGAVQAAEQRSAQAVQKMGRDVLAMAEAVNRRLQGAEASNAEAVAHVSGEMARVAEAMETRLSRSERAQSESLERLSAELGRISDKLSDRLLVSEKRAAEAIDDVGEQVSRFTERLAQSQERASQDLADKIQESEARTARLLEETCVRLEHRLGEAPPPATADTAAPPLAAIASAPTAAAFGPELFSRAEDAEEDELELDEAVGAPFGFRLPPPDSAEAFVPIPEPEEDLFGLDQPDPPPEEPAQPSLSTREVIEQARAAARAAGPTERVQVKARASWRMPAKPIAFGSGLFNLRPKRASNSTLQTAILVAGGAAFLSVGAAGVVLMQGPSKQGVPPRAAVALSPQALGGAAPGPAAIEAVRPPAQLADALLVAYTSAVKGVEAGQPGALARLKAIAEAGHPPAQFYLGKLYETGEHGVKQNMAEARRWTERAAEGGDPAAMHNLALFQFRGEGGPQNLAAAARWFHVAAEQGVVDSQYNLGLLYQSGSGTARDLAQAYAWFSIGGGGRDPQARANASAIAADLSPQQRAAADQMISAFGAQARSDATSPRLAAADR